MSHSVDVNRYVDIPASTQPSSPTFHTTDHSQSTDTSNYNTCQNNNTNTLPHNIKSDDNKQPYNRRIPPSHPVNQRNKQESESLNFIRKYIWGFYPTVYAWHFSISWLLGSICFVIASCGLLFIKNHINQSTAIAYGCVALTGACLFTYGAVFQWLQVLQVPVQYDPLTDQRKGIYESDNNPSNYYKSDRINRTGSEILCDSNISLLQRINLVFNQWSRIDYILIIAQLIGAILFNINTVVQVGWWKSVLEPGSAGGNNGLYLGLNIGPDITGCCLFTIAGYLSILEQSQSLYPKLPTTIPLAAMYCNLIGGLGFLVNAVMWLFYYQTTQEYLLFIPLVIGSVAFVFSSYYFYYEQLSGFKKQ